MGWATFSIRNRDGGTHCPGTTPTCLQGPRLAVDGWDGFGVESSVLGDLGKGGMRGGH